MVLTRKRLYREIDEQRVTAAIGAAEKRTSGEIRVAISRFFWGDVRRVADHTFDRLGMHATVERNGVLLFVVPSRRRFAIVGDAGIHDKVHPGFWDEVAVAVSDRFRSGDYTGGIVGALEAIAHELESHFPRRDDDVNELPDAVEFLE